jgi:hypothetical protein
LPAGSYCMCFAFCDLGRVLLLPRVFYFLSSRPSRWGGGLNSRRDGYKTPMLVSMATPFSIRTRITDVHERKRRMRESPGNSPQRLLIAQSLALYTLHHRRSSTSYYDWPYPPLPQCSGQAQNFDYFFIRNK